MPLVLTKHSCILTTEFVLEVAFAMHLVVLKLSLVFFLHQIFVSWTTTVIKCLRFLREDQNTSAAHLAVFELSLIDASIFVFDLSFSMCYNLVNCTLFCDIVSLVLAFELLIQSQAIIFFLLFLILIFFRLGRKAHKKLDL